MKDMRSDQHVMFGHNMTWKEHLEYRIYCKIKAESQSVNHEDTSGRETEKYLKVATLACELMEKEQDRQDDIQRFFKMVVWWLKKSPRHNDRFKTATALFTRAKLMLKKEREWTMKREIHDIQDSVQVRMSAE